MAPAKASSGKVRHASRLGPALLRLELLKGESEEQRQTQKKQVLVRGPKPATVLRSRKVRIDRAASDPFTTHEVLAEMHGTPLRGKCVVVQRYGETNRELQAALEREGAEVIEITTYRGALPKDTAPLLRLIDALDRDEIDLVAFTSASHMPPSCIGRRRFARSDMAKAGYEGAKLLVGDAVTRAAKTAKTLIGRLKRKAARKSKSPAKKAAALKKAVTKKSPKNADKKSSTKAAKKKSTVKKSAKRKGA